MLIVAMRCKMYGGVKCVVILAVMVFSLTRDVTSFNFNVGSRIVYSAGGRTNNHSYFGYSLVLRGGDRPLIIVGAPRDTSQYMGHSNIKDPGAIYMCNIQTNVAKSECQQKILDVEGNTRHNLANGKAFQHRKDNMWLGMTVAGTDMNNGTVVMCAPRWINQFHREYHLANGLCYSIAQTDASRKPADVLQLIPLVDKYNQGFQITNPEDNREKSNYFYAYGQAGISMKLNEDGSELILGAPGIYVWTGSVVRYSVVRSNEKLYFMKKNIQNPYYTPELTDTTYFGYSVDSGKYIAGRSDLYVAGAPRGANYKGQVLLFDFPLRENARYIIFATLEGHQFGEYFGSTLASIDINQDGLADLIVGAPMYAQKYSSDQGRVYVYMNHDKANLVEQEATIGGSLQNGARFGSSIAPIGDINEDGFMDVAIGAPYENDGKGAVYIYLGAKNGLNPNYTQRIVMDDMQGFGISISRGVDIDKNSCKDIAIGAYESAKAVLLRCHPSIDVTSTIEAFPSELSLQSTNFTAKICHIFSGSTSFNNEIRVKLAVDHEYKSASLENLGDATYIVSGSAGNSYCKEVIVRIDPSKNDFSRPIKVEANFELKQNPMFDSVFCEKCAVLRPSTKRETSLRVPFATGCGDDLVCQPDLKLKIKLLENNPYVIGSSSVITLNISVENIGEPAFLARVEFTPPSTAPLLRVPPRCRLIDSLLSCDFENPLVTHSKSFVIIELDASLLTSYHSAIKLNVSAISGGEEVTPEDNIQELDIQLITQANILVVGEAAGDGYIYINPSLKKTPNITISHTYEVLNEGPTPLDAFHMKYYIPVAYLDEVTNINYPLVNVFEPVDFQNQAPFLCSVQNGNFYEEDTKGHSVEYATDSSTEASDAVTEPGEATISYSEASTLKSSQELFSQEVFGTDTEVELPSVVDDGKYPSAKALNFSCTDKQRVTCMVVNCVKIGGLPAGGNGAHMVLKMQLNITNIEAVLKKDSSLLLTTFGVALKPSKVYGSTRSLILGSAPPPPSLPIWIIILAVLLGILVLALFSYVLYRIGFFKRKTKENLKLLKNAEGNNTDTMDDLSSHEDQ